MNGEWKYALLLAAGWIACLVAVIWCARKAPAVEYMDEEDELMEQIVELARMQKRASQTAVKVEVVKLPEELKI